MIELIHRWSEVIFSDRLQAPEKEWKYVKPKINRFKCHLTSWLHERNWIVVQLLSCVQLFVTPWTAALQASLSITNSQSLLKLTSIESAMPSNHPILCRPLLLLPSIFPSIRVFSNKSAFHIRWSKYWSFSFSIKWLCGSGTKRNLSCWPALLSSPSHHKLGLSLSLCPF